MTLTFRICPLEQGDAVGGIVVARWIEDAVQQRLAAITAHRVYRHGTQVIWHQVFGTYWAALK